MGFFNWIEDKFAKPLLDFLKKFSDIKVLADKNDAINVLKHAPTIADLEQYKNEIPETVFQNTMVQHVYEQRKRELEKKGLKNAGDVVAGWLGQEIAGGIWLLEEKALPNILRWIDDFGKAYNVKMSELEAMKKLAQSGEFGLMAVVSAIIGMTVYPFAMATIEPFVEKTRQTAFSKEPVNIASENILLTMLYREIINEKTFTQLMKLKGYSNEQIKYFIESYKYYPSAEDFIRFAVRDVFHSDIVKKYGYDERFPEEIVKYAKKSGIDEQTLRWYWRSHWQLPTPEEAFTMMHRGAIDEKTLKELLITADYSPFFIDKYIKISYLPYTRVDIRRMYIQGILNEKQVFQAYKELGYDDEKAKNLTEFTKSLSLTKEKHLSKSEILTAWIYKEINDNEAIKQLKELGYNENDAKLILKITKETQKRRLEREYLTTLKWEYAYDMKSKSDIIKEFNRMNFNQYKQKILIEEFDLFKRRHKARNNIKSEKTKK